MRLALIIGLIVQSALLQASTLIDGLYYDLDTSNRTATVTYEVDGTGNYASLSANVKIPESVVYNGVTFTVTKIADKAFANCTVMESISIPGTVTQVGDLSRYSDDRSEPKSLPFYNCTSLRMFVLRMVSNHCLYVLLLTLPIVTILIIIRCIILMMVVIIMVFSCHVLLRVYILDEI